jgi:hypothetical protein
MILDKTDACEVHKFVHSLPIDRCTTRPQDLVRKLLQSNIMNRDCFPVDDRRDITRRFSRIGAHTGAECRASYPSEGVAIAAVSSGARGRETTRMERGRLGGAIFDMPLSSVTSRRGHLLHSREVEGLTAGRR